MTRYLRSVSYEVVGAAESIDRGLGRDGALLAMRALRAGWLTPGEAERLEPLAAALAFVLDVELPAHRGPAPLEGHRVIS